MPHTWLIENYVTAWKKRNIFLLFKQCDRHGRVLFFDGPGQSVLGAYGLSRFEFQGKAFVLIICLGGLMLSPQVSF